MAALPRFLVLGLAGSLSGSLRGGRFWFGFGCVVICRGFASLCWCSPVDWLRQWFFALVVWVALWWWCGGAVVVVGLGVVSWW
jgi:hypothetical protein